MVEIKLLENPIDILNESNKFFFKIQKEEDIIIINNIIHLLEINLEIFISKKKIIHKTLNNKILLPFKPLRYIEKMYKIENNNFFKITYFNQDNNEIEIKNKDIILQENYNNNKNISYEVHYITGYDFKVFINTFPVIFLLIEEMYKRYNYDKFLLPKTFESIITYIKSYSL
jgi:hypothetical protein